MKVGGLFSGIGGFELGLVRAGFEISWMVEIDEFCRKVLKKHAPEYWSNARILEDVTKVTKEELSTVDLICGGFPCQPFSQAGKRRGKADDRYLWPEMLRIISELKPRWIIGENVAGFINMELENAFIDLETEGYKVEAFVLPACAIFAPHRRDRIWIIAYPKSERWITINNGVGQKTKQTSCTESYEKVWRYTTSKSISVMGHTYIELAELPRTNNGLSSELDKNRLKALGNAVVPQIPEILGRCILEIENDLLSKTPP